MYVYICVCQQLVVIPEIDIDGSRQQVSKTLIFNSSLIGVTAQENFSAFICHDNFQF
jgi:hypothetical protein